MAGWAERGAVQGVAPLAPPPESPASGAPAHLATKPRYSSELSIRGFIDQNIC